MAKDLNKVQLTGRLGADPEMRYTAQGNAVTTFRVASNRSWRTAEGETKEDTEWFSIVTWNKLAEICNQYLTKGTRVYIEGRSQTRSWEDAQSGQTRYKTEIVANDMIMLDSRRDAGNYNDDVVDQGQTWDDEPEPEPIGAAPARRAAPAARSSNGNGNGASRDTISRSEAPAPAARPAARAAARPAARSVVDEDDLPF